MTKHTQGWRASNGKYQSDTMHAFNLIEQGLAVSLAVATTILLAPYIINILSGLIVLGGGHIGNITITGW